MGVKFDVTNAESGGFKRLPPGMYQVKITAAIDRTEADNPKNDMQIDMSPLTGKHKDTSIRTWVSFNDNADWKLKEFCAAAGLALKGDSTRLAKSAVGKKLGIQVVTDVYQGKENSKVQTFLPLDAFDDDDDDIEEDEDEEAEEEPAPKTRRKTSRKPEPEPEDDEEADEEDDEEEDDEDEDEAEDYTEWELDELTTEMESRGLDMPKRLKKDDDDSYMKKLVKALEKDDGTDSPF